MKYGIIILLLLAANSFAQPAPHPANAEIQAVVDQINPDSLLNHVTALQNFFTRNTYSDTVSNVTGLGASMRWVKTQVDTVDTANVFSFEWFPWTNGVSRNLLIAHRAGTEENHGRYILGGHIDSRNTNNFDPTGFAPGANDNASSCAGFMEMARLFPQISIDHDLELIWFTGEEQGLWGSEAYANHLAQEQAQVNGMIAMDMNGRITAPGGAIDSTSLRLYAEGTTQQGGTGSPSRRLQRYIKWVGEAYMPGHEMVIFAAPDRPGRGSDHLSFSAAGYAGVRFIERNEDIAFQHNVTDLVDYYTPTYGRKNMICAMSALTTMLKAPLAPEAPNVENTFNGDLQIRTNDGLPLPDGYSIYVAIREWTDNYWQTVEGPSQENLIVYPAADHIGEYLYVSISIANENDLPSPFSEETEIMVEFIDAANPAPAIVDQLTLSTSPNPFNSAVEVNFNLPNSGNVKIAAYDMLGREYTTLIDGFKDRGEHAFTWSPQHLSTGIYFLRLESNDKMITHKLLYLK